MTRFISRRLLCLTVAWCCAVLAGRAQSADALETNETLPTATAIAAGTNNALTFHTTNDVDYLKFTAEPYHLYSIRTTNLSTNIDTVITLYNGATNALAAEDDSAGEKRSLLNYYYRDTVNSTTLYVHVYRYNSTWNSQALGTYDLLLTDHGSMLDAYEHDNSLGVASNIAIGVAQTNRTLYSNDTDYVAFPVTSNNVYQVYAQSEEANFFTRLTLFHVQGTTTSQVEQVGSSNWLNTVTYWANYNGTAFVAVTKGQYSGVVSGHYAFAVSNVGAAPISGLSDSYEYDDTVSNDLGNARYIQPGTSQAHSFYPGNDVDRLFVTNLTANHLYRLGLSCTNRDFLYNFFNADVYINSSITTNVVLGVTSLTYNFTWVAGGVEGCNFIPTNTAPHQFILQPTDNASGYYPFHRMAGYTVLLEDAGAVTNAPDMYEPDNAATNAGTIAADGTPQVHTFFPAGDTDYVKFSADSNSVYRIWATNTVGLVSPNLTLYGTNGVTWLDSATYGTPIERFFAVSGAYYVAATDAGTEVGGYTLMVQKIGAGGDVYEYDNEDDKAYQILPSVPQAHTLTDAADADWLKLAVQSNRFYQIAVSNVQGFSPVLYVYDSTNSVSSRSLLVSGGGSSTTAVCGVKGPYDGYVFLKVFTWSAPANGGYYTVTVTDQGTGADGYEADNSVTGAYTVAVSTLAKATTVATLSRTLHGADDDWMKFTVQSGRVYRVSAAGTPFSEMPDGIYAGGTAYYRGMATYYSVTLGLYDTDPRFLLDTDSSDASLVALGNSRVEFTARGAGPYYAKVSGFTGWHPYTLTIEDLGAVGSASTPDGYWSGVYDDAAVSPDGRVYIPGSWTSRNNTYSGLVVIEPTGARTNFWRAPSSPVTSPTLGTNETAYLGCADGGVYQYDASGALINSWLLGTNYLFMSQPAIGPDGRAYVTWRDTLSVTNVANGVTNVATRNVAKVFGLQSGSATNRVWLVDQPTSSFDPIVGETGAVLVVAYGTATNYSTNVYGIVTTNLYYPGALYELDPSGGGTTRTWSVQRPTDLVMGQAGPVVVGLTNLFLFNASGTTGAVVTLTNGNFASAAVGTNGAVYVGFYNASNGISGATNGVACYGTNGVLGQVWRTVGPVYYTPALCGDGTLYAPDDFGTLYALSSSGGTNWVANANYGWSLRNPIVAPDGTIYIKGYYMSGVIFAVNASSALASGGWPMVHHDYRHSGYAGYNRTGPTATASDGLYLQKVRVSWTTVSGAQAYEVWRGTNSDATLASSIGTTNGAYLDDENTTVGEVYYYWVRALTAVGAGELGAGDSGYEDNALGDYFGDGFASFVLYAELSGNWHLYSPLGGSSATIQHGGVGYEPVAGDYDGDGILDLTVYGANTWYIRLSGSGNYVAAVGFGASGYEPVAGDFDGDGLSDLALYSDATGLWGLRLSGSGYALSTLSFGAVGYVPTPDDFDGDGKDDFAIYSDAAGTWYIRLSASGNALVPVGFGAAGYEPVTGDFDGDGLSDLALYNGSAHTWAYLLSGSGYAMSTLTLALPGYAPACRDYDGDGAVDFTIYGEADGLWYVRASAYGNSIVPVSFGGSGKEPVTP